MPVLEKFEAENQFQNTRTGMKKIVNVIMGLSVFLLFSVEGTMAGTPIDNQIYASLLEKNVRHKSVDYDGFKKDESMLDTYLNILSRTDTTTLSGNDLFAFYINVYNAFTIKLVLSKYPGINSIKEIGGFFSNPWSKKFIPLNARTVSLDYIEHEILRPKFKDPRVHFAINCASKSCPKLLNKPYEGSILESQLDDQARDFINDKKNNYIKQDTLYISKIFKWFKEDFNDNPLSFIKRYADKDFKEALMSSNDKLNIAYLHYEWSLNR